VYSLEKSLLCRKLHEILVHCFTELTDPRVDWTKDHLIGDIIFITIAAVICGAETLNEIEQYGKSKQLWLSQYLRLPNGIPSHDTFNRFFSAWIRRSLKKAFPVMDKGHIVSNNGGRNRKYRRQNDMRFAFIG
jgi:hypothetical protein